MFLDPIQDSLELHPVVRLREVVCVGTAILSKSTRDASSIVAPRARVEADGSVDAENAPTDPCKTTERFCTSSHTPHQRFPFRRTHDRNPQTQWVSYPQILRRSLLCRRRDNSCAGRVRSVGSQRDGRGSIFSNRSNVRSIPDPNPAASVSNGVTPRKRADGKELGDDARRSRRVPDDLFAARLFDVHG
jgi:hypothetical protein